MPEIRQTQEPVRFHNSEQTKAPLHATLSKTLPHFESYAKVNNISKEDTGTSEISSNVVCSDMNSDGVGTSVTQYWQTTKDETNHYMRHYPKHYHISKAMLKLTIFPRKTQVPARSVQMLYVVT